MNYRPLSLTYSMAFRFEDLHIWKDALTMSKLIHDLTKSNFPKDELFVLTSQVKRAADSVVLNIAEGSTGQSKATFRQFLSYSLRSSIEVVSCLFIARDRGYISQQQFLNLYSKYETLVKMITAMRNSIK